MGSTAAESKVAIVTGAGVGLPSEVENEYYLDSALLQ